MKSAIAKVPLRTRLVVVVPLFVVATWAAYKQYTADYVWHDRYSWTEVAWHPIDWHVDAGLPEIRNARSVQVIAGATWLAGNEAFLAFSKDAGIHWTQLEYSVATGVFTQPGVPLRPRLRFPQQRSRGHSLVS